MKVSTEKFVKVLLVMLITIFGTVLFTLYTLSLYSALNISTPQVYIIPSYVYVIYFMAGMVGFTALILLLIRLKLGAVVFWMFAIILTLILVEFFSSFISIFGIPLAILVVYYYYRMAGNTARNAINLVMFVTVGSILALALGATFALVLTAIVAVYDYIAVFRTKHMITLAKGMIDYGFFAGLVLMAKKLWLPKDKFIIGGGDLIFPAMLSTAVFLAYPITAFLLTAFGAVLGLALLLWIGKKGKAYPAMAFMGPLEILFFGVYIFLTII